MPVRYTALPNPGSTPDTTCEMEEAFASDEEHDGHDASESTPLTQGVDSAPAESSLSSHQSAAIPTYDFERSYDFPPPGSPPGPSSRALPNDFGNSNGLLPTSPIVRPQPKPSLFRRIMGAVVPSQYMPLATDSNTRPTGGGLENDGVFANVVAKPQPAHTILSDNGDIHIVPEETQKDAPPSYQDAQADAVPPYWETTIHAPGLGPGADFIIEDLPAGSFIIFCLNIFISFFFQFVGFLLTYLLHTTHAAKYGSRAGLGLTLIQFGLYSRTLDAVNQAEESGEQGTQGNWLPNTPQNGPSNSTPPQLDQNEVIAASRDWLSILLMTFGWFLLLSSVLAFWKVKRWERSVRPQVEPTNPEDVERDREVYSNLEEIFGYSAGGTRGTSPQARQLPSSQIFRNSPHSSYLQAVRQEENLTRDLRAAGLI